MKNNKSLISDNHFFPFPNTCNSTYKSLAKYVDDSTVAITIPYKRIPKTIKTLEGVDKWLKGKNLEQFEVEIHSKIANIFQDYKWGTFNGVKIYYYNDR